MTIHRCASHSRTLQAAFSLSLVAWILLSLGSLSAQSPPPHPRLLFRTADIPQIAAKVGNPATIPGAYYARMATTVAPIPIPALGSSSWMVREHLRGMQEIAFRYQVSGRVGFGDSARQLLLQFVRLNSLPINGILGASFGCALAITFDLIYDRLSSAERKEVVIYLESWILLHSQSMPLAPLEAYQDATDDESIRAMTGIALIAMAIWEDSSLPDPLGLMRQNLSKLRGGWMDLFSPDGSIDTSFSFANQGPLYSLNAGIAAINCGLGDYLAGTNALKCGRWLATASVADTYLSVGLMEPQLRISRMDPIAYYAIGRTGDAEALWFFDRDWNPTIAGLATDRSAFSPLISLVTHYPTSLWARQPQQASAFFRDNANFPSLRGTKLRSNPMVGQGGHAYLHNSADSTWVRMGAYYNIRDEWVNHGQADDGHFSLSLVGLWHYNEQRIARQGNGWEGWRADNHNIVTIQGVPPFLGAPSSNPYFPPAQTPVTFGSYGGRAEVTFVSQDADYIQGRHDYMWQMQKARRGVLMIKDPFNPHVILIDNVNRDGTFQTYDELFNASVACSGTGSVVDPMVTSISGQAVSATWLAPQVIAVTPGTLLPLAPALEPAFQNRVTASGIDVTFISNHGPNVPTALSPLAGALLATQGGIIQWPTTTEKILFRDDTSTPCPVGSACMGDQQTASDARLLWIEEAAGSTTGWIAVNATTVTHLGIPLLATNQPVTTCARNGRVSIQTQDPVTGPSLAATLNVGFQVTEVLLNGVATAFVQTGTQIRVGGGSLPNPSSDDRAYTFTNGWLGDALPTPSITVTAGDALTSTSGLAPLRLKSGTYYSARPIAVAMDIELIPNARNRAAGFRIEQTQGTGNGIDIFISPSSNSDLLVEVQAAGVLLGRVTTPLDLVTQSTARLSAEYDRLLGTLRVLSPLGAALRSFTLPAATTPFFVTALVSPDAIIDNITVFDSAEDGVTPQGVAFFTNPQRIAGFALRAPNLPAFQELRPIYRGAFLPPAVADLWFSTGGLQERSVLKHLPTGSTLPSTVAEVVLEWSVQSIPFGINQATGLWLRTAAGVPLMGILEP